MKYLKNFFSVVIAFGCVMSVPVSHVADARQDKTKVYDLSYGLLLKAQPILEKGRAEDVANLPDALKSLDGQRVRITGYLLIPREAYYLNKTLEAFAVSQNAFGCPCCTPGPPPTIFNILRVKADKGAGIEPPYPPRITVEGMLRIEPEYENGELVALYSITEAKAQKKSNSIF
jgi:hypothetical protein